MSRRTVAALLGISLLPALTAVATVRPAVGQEQPYGLYAMRMSGGSTFVDGEVGAGGGLAVLDGGVPYASGRLDSSPNAAVQAAAVEPGTLVRTVAGVANQEAGEQVFDVPLAEAQHPGNGEGRVEGSGEQDLGGLTASAGSAVVTASAEAITAQASGSSQVVVPGGAATATALTRALRPLRLALPSRTSAEPARAEGLVTSDGAEVRGASSIDADGVLSATFTSTVSRVEVLGEIELRGVSGTATATTAPDGSREADASIAVEAITVAGVPVRFGSEGLEAAGETLLPGEDVRGVTEMVLAALEAANVTIEPLAPTETTEQGSARADSRGVRITIVNPGAPEQGLPGDRLTYVLGGAAVSIADEPPLPPAAPLPVATTTPPPPPVEPQPTPDAAPSQRATTAPVPAGSSGGNVGSGSVTTTTTDGPAVAATSVPQPQVAAPAPSTAAAPVLVAGRRIDKRLAIAAFGGWQLLSLSVCTAAVFALRRRTVPA